MRKPDDLTPDVLKQRPVCISLGATKLYLTRLSHNKNTKLFDVSRYSTSHCRSPPSKTSPFLSKRPKSMIH